MLLKLTLNLFSRRKRFKREKNTFKLFIRFDLVFLSVTLQHDKARPLKIVCSSFSWTNWIINMLINFFLFILKKISNEA